MTTPDAPTSVYALIAKLRDPYRGHWTNATMHGACDEAAAALATQAQEMTRITEWAQSCLEAGFHERQHAERAEARVKELEEERNLSTPREWIVRATEAEARVAELEAQKHLWTDQMRTQVNLCERLEAMEDRADKAEARVAELQAQNSWQADAMDASGDPTINGSMAYRLREAEAALRQAEADARRYRTAKLFGAGFEWNGLGKLKWTVIIPASPPIPINCEGIDASLDAAQPGAKEGTK